MSDALLHRVAEHCGYPKGVSIPEPSEGFLDRMKFQNNTDKNCYEITQDGNDYRLHTSYFIGVDWIKEGNIAVQVVPKIDNDLKKMDFLRMLSIAMNHPDVLSNTTHLYDIKFDRKAISIPHTEDYLTPLLIIQYVIVLKEIVRKGLKRSYYAITNNLASRIKGKVLISKTIKKNHYKNDFIKTYCTYDEFGVDSIENRILKKAYLFGRRYMKAYGIELNQNDLNYIDPALRKISSDVSLSDLKHLKFNAIYKEYNEAIRLAKFILKRFGYNISNIRDANIVKTPPFWIDMSLLFELYILGLLKNTFSNKINYHFTAKRNELDFLLNSNDYKLIIDAKYKPKYLKSYNIDDIRQLSGYARLSKVYEVLGKTYSQSIDCLIIYPHEEGISAFDGIDLKNYPIDGFEGFYKLGVQLPMQQNILSD